MLTAILILIGDLAVGAAAYKLARSNEKRSKETHDAMQGITKILENHDGRITKLEAR